MKNKKIVLTLILVLVSFSLSKAQSKDWKFNLTAGYAETEKLRGGAMALSFTATKTVLDYLEVGIMGFNCNSQTQKRFDFSIENKKTKEQSYNAKVDQNENESKNNMNLSAYLISLGVDFFKVLHLTDKHELVFTALSGVGYKQATSYAENEDFFRADHFSSNGFSLGGNIAYNYKISPGFAIGTSISYISRIETLTAGLSIGLRF